MKVLFAADSVVSRTVCQLFTCGLVTGVNVWNWCKRILNVWFVLRRPHTADKTLKSTNSLSLSPSLSLLPSLQFDLQGSPSRGGDVAAYVFDINQPRLPTPFYSVVVSLSVFMALSIVFHSINSLDDSPFSHSVLPVLFLPHWSFQLYISLWKSPSALM